MSPRTPWLLAAVCVGLGVLLVLLETRWDAPAKSARAALLPLPARQIQRIDLQWPSARAVLRRGATGWWLERPGTHRRPADPDGVEAALAELELLSRGGEVLDVAPGAPHGLVPPRLLVTVAGAGRVASVSLGARAGARRIYAGVDNRLYLVDSRALTLWGAGPEELVDRRLVRFDPETTTKIDLSSIGLERRTDRWYLSRPADARANPDRVRELLDLLASLHATLEGKGEPIDLTIVDAKGRHRGRGRVTPEALGRVHRILTRLPDKRPVRIPGAWIHTLEIGEGDRKLRLTRRREGWFLPGGAAAESGAVSAWLGALNRLEAREILGREAVRLAEPVQRVLAWESPAGRGALRLGPARAKRRAARFAGETAVYVFADGAWAEASADPLDWRRRLVWDLPAASIEAIALGDAEIRRDERFRWQRVRPAGPAPASADAEGLVKALARPRVRRFLRAPLRRVVATVRVETIDGTKRTWFKLEVGSPAPGGGRFGRAGGRTLIFEEKVWRMAVEVLRPGRSDP